MILILLGAALFYDFSRSNAFPVHIQLIKFKSLSANFSVSYWSFGYTKYEQKLIIRKILNRALSCQKKIVFFWKVLIFLIFLGKCQFFRKIFPGWSSYSTSHPSGDLVDGLPVQYGKGIFWNSNFRRLGFVRRNLFKFSYSFSLGCLFDNFAGVSSSTAPFSQSIAANHQYFDIT